MKTDRFKTRVWEADKKRMLYQDFMVKPNGLILFQTGCLMNDYINTNAILMQSIGQRDNAGRLIYEGDIYMDQESHTRYTGVVEYKHMCFQCKIPSYNNKLDFTPIRTMSVIGNIYEHPELLEE